MTAQLVPGARAPVFRLPDATGGSVALADFKGSKLVLFFYPKAGTSGCTREAQAFSALKGAFTRAGAEIRSRHSPPSAKNTACRLHWPATKATRC